MQTFSAVEFDMMWTKLRLLISITILGIPNQASTERTKEFHSSVE